MENLNIEETNYTPAIDFDFENGVLNFSGKSYPENAFDFYKTIKDWLKEYLEENSNEKTVLNLELTYLNSSSLKAYFDIFDILENAQNNGKDIEVNWIYESDDDIIEETGEDFVADFEGLDIKLMIKD